nr:unnamed protein product [Callosobruchus chinensis]
MGAMSTIKPCKNQYTSNIFLRKKWDGSERVILNLKSLNKFTKTAHFKISIFEGKIYEYNSMPFDLNCAHLVFTKIMKPVLSHLSTRWFMPLLYLEDFLLIGRSYSKCSENVSVTVNLLESLGFIINCDKSTLTPSRDVSYLGMHYNSQDMTVSLTTDKRLHMMAITKKFSKKKHCKIRDFAHFLGKTVACCPAIKYS